MNRGLGATPTEHGRELGDSPGGRVGVYLGLGTNAGSREKNLEAAVNGLSEFLTHIRRSRLYRTLPRYRTDQPVFLNCVVTGMTEADPESLLTFAQSLELNAGRDRIASGRMGPRPLDVDILLYGEQVISTERLVVPHPSMKERKFVLVPLLELDSHLRDPLDGTPYREHLSKLEPQGIYYYSLREFIFT